MSFILLGFFIWEETIKGRESCVFWWGKCLRAFACPFSASQLLPLRQWMQSLVAHFFSCFNECTHRISSPVTASLSSLSVSLVLIFHPALPILSTQWCTEEGILAVMNETSSVKYVMFALVNYDFILILY